MLDSDERKFLRFRLAGSQAKLFPLRGEYITLQEAAERSGINIRTLRTRLSRDGFTLEEAMAQPVGKRRRERTGKLYLFREAWRTIREIAALAGITEATAYNRRCGNRVMEADEAKDWRRDQPYEPAASHKLVTFRGKTRCIAHWARELGIPKDTLYQRLRKGWTLTRAFGEPVMRPTARTLYQGNRRTIRRIAFAAKTAPTSTKTGGQSQTFAKAEGTGVGSNARDLHHDEGAPS